MQLSISKHLGCLMTALALALLLLPSTAVAHEPREVGKYDFSSRLVCRTCLCRREERPRPTDYKPGNQGARHRRPADA